LSRSERRNSGNEHRQDKRRANTLAGTFLGDLKTPGVLPVAGSALVLLLAAVIASVIPAARAARVDVMQALRTE